MSIQYITHIQLDYKISHHSISNTQFIHSRLLGNSKFKGPYLEAVATQGISTENSLIWNLVSTF